MKWEETYIINIHDADLNGIVSVSGLLRYMQDACNCQMREQKPSYEELFDAGYAFVLSRLGLSIYKPLHAHETITVQTWAVASRGLIYNRCFRVLRDGDIVAEATSAWALVGVKDRKLHRVGEIPLAYWEDEPLELDLPARFRIPSEVNLSLRGERTVLYADVDQNRHLNNTRYPDIFCSFFPDMPTSRVSTAVLSFVNEAPMGETLKIYTGEYDGLHYVRSLRQDGTVNAEGEFLLEPIRNFPRSY